jgi:hypothetical protein
VEPVKIGADEPLLTVIRENRANHAILRSGNTDHQRVLLEQLLRQFAKIGWRHIQSNRDRVGKSIERGNVRIDLGAEPIGNEVQFVFNLDLELAVKVCTILALVDVATGGDDNTRDHCRDKRRSCEFGDRADVLAQSGNDQWFSSIRAAA